LVPRLAAYQLGIDSRKVATFENMVKFKEKVKDMPMYLAYVYKKPNFEFVADTIRMCVRRYGIKFVAFDNLHFLVRSMSDQTKEVSVIVQGFKLLAEELSIPILLIARPRKSKETIIVNEDIKDSADVEADSDIVLLLHRERKDKGKDSTNTIEGNFEPKCLVRVSKARYAPGGDCYLNFDDAICKVTEFGK
jgi:replicative DNA helicase